ncbi:MAG: LamG-like jellyroll fold domain-containing protein [Thermodesulfobacteriota bacterium]|nr:LamG-like jellyroll fold domain-containing protein [Thermodesulfobacteriota bacterium]
MKKSRLCQIFGEILTIIALAGTPAYAQYHHVTDCTVCHFGLGGSAEASACGGSENLKMIREEIVTPESGTRQVVFTATDAYVRGAPDYDGICEICHTAEKVTYYRNDSLGAPHPEYQSGLGGPGSDCMVCHKHAPYEFGHEATIGTGCDPCHGQAGGSGTAFSHATHTAGTVPKGPATAMACNDCHDGNNYPLFGNDDAMEALAATTVCDGCHSQGGLYGGSETAKAEWTGGAYESDGVTLKAGKEDWCAHCHDDAPASINGRTAKNVTGDDVVFGYYVSGHGNYNTSCTGCHDPGLTHIDAYAKTYHAEECETDPSRSYRNGYRLVLAGGEPPLAVPRTEDYDTSHFALCYGCHREEVIVGGGNHTPGSGSSSIPYSTSPIQTYFAQLAEQGLGVMMWDDPPNNIHTEIHLDNWQSWDSDLREEIYDSATSCTSCHDPHSKAAYQNRATHSMTRGDLGIVYRREIMGWSAWPNSNGRGLPGGDLAGCQCCHNNYGPSYRYYFMLGTALAEGDSPAFFSELDQGYDITNPQNGNGGAYLGGSFATYDRNGTRIGLLIEDTDEGCTFPATNLNADQDVIDFWYVPTFNFAENSENHCLVEACGSANDYLTISVTATNTLLFSLREQGNLHSLESNTLNWTVDSVHHIRCTWGVYGMHMYLDRGMEVYGDNSGVDYLGGMNGASLPVDVFIGRRHDEQEPADGIIDDLKIYGYQYQKFSQPLSLFSRLGTLDEVQNPERGFGGNVLGDVNFFDEGDTPGPDNGPWRYSQHGYSVGIYDDQYFGVYKGVIRFPTSNLRVDQDTVDFWWGPMFSVASNTDARVLLYCSHSSDDWWGIRLYYDRLHFFIKESGQVHELYTLPIQNLWHDTSEDVRLGGWFHVVCSWGPEGMHIYINDHEAGYDPAYDGGTSYTGGLGTLPDWLMVGNTAEGADYYMDSMMDELRIYGYQETHFPKKPQKMKEHTF